MSAAGLYSIEKLDDSNYASWSVHMKSVLVHSDLWGITSGKLIKGEAASATESAAFDAKDEKALASIMLCIKPSQINHVRHCLTSTMAWNKLKEIYQPCGPARKISLFKRLMHLSLSEGASMSEHINEFFETIEKLAEISVTVPEEMMVIILLSSLPDSFESFVVAIETRDTLPALNVLKVKLLEEGARRLERGGKVAEAGESQQAFVARVNAKRCSKFKNSGESDSSLGSSLVGSGGGSRGKRRVNGKCYRCGRRGHFASHCKDPKKDANEHSFSILASASNNTLDKDSWCIDSGATSHLCCDRNLFLSYWEGKEKIMLAGDNFIEAEGRGDVSVTCNGLAVTLKNVLHVPTIQGNFISVSRAVDNGLAVVFDGESAIIRNHNGDVVMKAVMRDGLFLLKADSHKFMIAKGQMDDAIEWHNRYGHLNFQSLKEMSAKKLVHGLKIRDVPYKNECVTCAKSKICVKPFPSATTSRSQDLLEIVHSDVCGPMNKNSIGGSRYFVTFIDDMSRFIFVYFVKSKDEVFGVFKSFKALVEKQTGRQIKILRSDNGGEYLSREFGTFLDAEGIKRELTVPHTPQQNGVAERANRTLVEMARSMIVHSGLDEAFWAEAVAAAAYLRNRSATKSLVDKTPYEVWTSKKPTVSHLKVFGSLAIAVDKTQSKKFQSKGKELIMVGYSDTSKAYRLYNPASKRVIVSRDVIFMEHSYVGSKDAVFDIITYDAGQVECLGTKNELDIGRKEISSEKRRREQEDDSSNDDCEKVVKFCSGRPRLIRTGRRGRPRKERHVLNLLEEDDAFIPQSVEEAVSSRDSKQWQASMQKEYDCLVKNGTWSLVELPAGQKLVGCKWVFNIKRNADGSIHKYKSRLVAKGCSQQFGVNFTETFSPVVRYATIRMIIALACEHNLHLHQLDVSSAYLNSDLHDTVYMKQPEPFVNKEFPKRVLKLNKALYGLKQSGREWNEKLDSVLKKIGFSPCVSEPCVYTKNHKGNFNIIGVYVDDLILASSELHELTAIKAQISNEFEVVDGGKLEYFLGMEIQREGDTGAVTVCQQQYINNLLNQYGMDNCRPVSTPLDAGFQVHCSNESCKRVNQTEYQSIIGALMYLAISSRPDILHSVCKLSQRNMDPHSEHEAGVWHILRYLKKTIDLKLHYSKTGQPIECFVDADWGGDASDRKSYTGCSFVAAGSVFSWESKKQNLVALSSTEAEYVALSTAAKEAVYIKKLITEIGFGIKSPMVLNSDNQSAQHLVKNPIYHARSKHIDIKYHHIRELYKNNEITLNYVNTNEMMSDILTKNLPKVKHCKFTQAMGLY